MTKLVKFVAVFAFLSSAPVFAGSLEEFIIANKPLNDNVEARMLIKQVASLMAYSEALSEGVDDTEARRKEILMQDGEKYGSLSLKRMKQYCLGEDIPFNPPSQPDKQTCTLLLSLK